MHNTIFKKVLIIILTIACVCNLTACGETSDNIENEKTSAITTTQAKKEVSFRATVTKVDDKTVTVCPLPETLESKSANSIVVPRVENDSILINEGDIVEICYNGEIQETYPAQICTVYSLTVISRNEYEGEILQGTNFDTHHFTIGWASDKALLWEKSNNKDKQSDNRHQYLPIFKIEDEFELEEFAEEFQDTFKTDILEAQFGKETFKENTLLLVYVEATSGSDTFELDRVQITEDSVYVHLKRLTDSRGTFTDDMVGWIIGIVVDSNKIKTCTKFNADLNNLY